jgi:hypothetical protein
MGVGGIEQTGTSPDGGIPIDLAENRLALAAAHAVSQRTRIGVLVQYTRLPDVTRALTGDRSVIALGAGVSITPSARMPLELAGMAATEGDAVYWLAGAGIASGEIWSGWRVHGQYGAAGGQLAPGVTHRLAAVGEWRDHVELTLGAAIEPDGTGRAVQPVLGADLSLLRYRLGVVREQLGNDFGGAWSFRFSVEF